MAKPLVVVGSGQQRARRVVPDQRHRVLGPFEEGLDQRRMPLAVPSDLSFTKSGNPPGRKMFSASIPELGQLPLPHLGEQIAGVADAQRGHGGSEDTALPRRRPAAVPQVSR
jgi:hypothetical protein